MTAFCSTVIDAFQICKQTNRLTDRYNKNEVKRED